MGGKGRQYPRKYRPNRDFSVRVVNISRQVHIKDLKSELRNRQCKPMSITWKRKLKFIKNVFSPLTKCCNIFSIHF